MDERGTPGIGEVFGRRLRHMRDLRGMSAKTLSDRLSERGVDVGRDSIAKWESKPARAQAVKLEAVIAIAAELNCSPAWLITPEDPGEALTIGNRTLPAGSVRLWLRGDWPLVGDDPEDFFYLMPTNEHEARRRAGQSRRERGLPMTGATHYATEREEDR